MCYSFNIIEIICKNEHFLSFFKEKNDYIIFLKKNLGNLKKIFTFVAQKMPNGVIGNTADSGSAKSRFESWLGNKKIYIKKYFFLKLSY